LRPGPTQEGALPLELIQGKVVSGAVILDEPLGLMEPHTQCIPELGMGDPVLTVKLEQVELARFSVEVRTARADLLLDVLRYLEADRHDRFPKAASR
jgi:hypothetical protein